MTSQEHEGQAFIVMEYVDGMSLSGLSATRPLERGELIRIVKETSSGLDYAHTQHVIHRDIKPANLMIDARGMVKIADFGIAKLANSSLTTTNMVMGTLEYMAPEQLRNDPLDGRSDQYSLAALTYALLTGVPAFAAASFAALAFKICNDPPAKPHIVNPELPPVLADVFEKALAKRPEDRFNTCVNRVCGGARDGADGIGAKHPSRVYRYRLSTLRPAERGLPDQGVGASH